MKNKFSDVFKKLRIQNKYTQEDIANKFDMTKTGISYWENGKSEPSLEVIEKLAELFNVSIDYLLGNSNTENDYGIMYNRTNVIGVVPSVKLNIRHALQIKKYLHYKLKVTA